MHDKEYIIQRGGYFPGLFFIIMLVETTWLAASGV
jgi:hypothetical protein